MKKIIFGIFAHPDDEAFGPSGTLLNETRNGTELHLILLTAGHNGLNPDNLPNLTEVRLEEWRRSGELLGATGMHLLGFVDGKLCNKDLTESAEKIEEIVKNTLKPHKDQAAVEFISLDVNGITGHIDHIVASYAAHLAFYRLKQAGLPLEKLLLACIPREQTGNHPNTDFVYMEPGRLPEEIDEVIDNRHLLKEVVEIMKCHHTQRDDCEKHLRKLGDKVAVNHFMIKR